MMFDLKNRVALITGGARGLGYAMARGLGAHGASLMLMDRELERTQVAARNLAAEGFDAHAIAGDVTNPDDSRHVIDAVCERLGRIDVCVNNAGVAALGAAEDVTLDEWNAVMDVNAAGVFFMAQAAARAMIAQRSGSIINIASMSGYIVNVPQKQSVYNISKAAVMMATKSLASEWAQHGIRVNAIAPGYMRTEMTISSLDNPALSRVWSDATPMGRPGEPHELAGAVVYLASDASSFVTGSVLVVDGGYTIR